MDSAQAPATRRARFGKNPHDELDGGTLAFPLGLVGPIPLIAGCDEHRCPLADRGKAVRESRATAYHRALGITQDLTTKLTLKRHPLSVRISA